MLGLQETTNFIIIMYGIGIPTYWLFKVTQLKAQDIREERIAKEREKQTVYFDPHIVQQQPQETYNKPISYKVTKSKNNEILRVETDTIKATNEDKLKQLIYNDNISTQQRITELKKLIK